MKLGNIESLRPYHINGRSVNNRFWSNEKASFSTSESIGVAMMMHEEVWEGTTGRKLWLMDGCGPHVGELMEWCAQRGIDIILRTPNLTDLLQNEDLHNFHVMRNNKDSGFMKLKHERLMENFRNGITGLTLGDNIECMDRAIRNAFTEQNNMTAHRMAGTRPFRAGPLRDLINRRNEEAQAAKAASARLEKTVAPSADGNTVRLLSSIIGMLGGGGSRESDDKKEEDRENENKNDDALATGTRLMSLIPTRRGVANSEEHLQLASVQRLVTDIKNAAGKHLKPLAYQAGVSLNLDGGGRKSVPVLKAELITKVGEATGQVIPRKWVGKDIGEHLPDVHPFLSGSPAGKKGKKGKKPCNMISPSKSFAQRYDALVTRCATAAAAAAAPAPASSYAEPKVAPAAPPPPSSEPGWVTVENNENPDNKEVAAVDRHARSGRAAGIRHPQLHRPAVCPSDPPACAARRHEALPHRDLTIIKPSCTVLI